MNSSHPDRMALGPSRTQLSGTFVVRWTARVLALAALLFWGAFFVAHVWEWFVVPQETPPPKVIGIVVLHAVLLLGLLIGWRWERCGALLVIVGGGAFFGLAAGRNALLFTTVTSIPAALWLSVSWRSPLVQGAGRRNTEHVGQE